MVLYFVCIWNLSDKKEILSVWATKDEAEREAQRLRESEKRLSNIYFTDCRTVQGDVFSLFQENKLIQNYQHITKEYNELKEHLRFLSTKIQTVFKEQPEDCLFGYGICGHPIEYCSQCPAHEWEIGTECKIF